MLVLVTDGQVGNEDQILRLLAPRLGGVRVYTVGVDTAVNEGFLKRLAGLGGGACELVESEDRLDEVMDRVHRRIGAPVLTDLELEPAGLGVDLGSLAPRRLPALFAGSPLVVSGRFEGGPGGAVTVRGRDAAGQPWSATVPATGGDASALTATWARAHLRDLEDRYATDPAPDRELERRIVETSLRFGVLCRFTAFVAADVRVVNEGGVVHRVLQPVEARPAGPCSSGSGWPPRPCRWPACRSAASSRGAGRRGPTPGRSPRQGRRPPRPVPGRVGPGRAARVAPAARRPSTGRRRPRPLSPPRRPARHPARERSPAPQVGAPAIGAQGAGSAREGELRRRLGLVQVGLDALVADLESVDAVEEEVRPLRDLAARAGPAEPAGGSRTGAGAAARPGPGRAAGVRGPGPGAATRPGHRQGPRRHLLER